jgi:predicted ATPase
MFPTICFSDECGLCGNCCQNTSESLSSKVDFSSQGAIYGENLSKMMGVKYVQEVKDRYNKNLKLWAKRYQFKDPFCYGYAPEKIKLLEGGNQVTFKIIDQAHSKSCIHPYCQMMYSSSTDWEKKTKYPNLPIYTNEHNTKYFCGPCMTDESFS